MGLIGIRGSYKNVNRALLLYSFEHSSCLLLDCSNCANPHKIFPHVSDDKLRNVHVIEIEMLYKFRDVLKHSKRIADKLNAECIVVTTFRALFNFDEKELQQ